MAFLKAAFRTKKGNKLSAEQQLNHYIPPPETFTRDKTITRAEKEPELDEEQQLRQLNSSTEYVRRVRELIRERYRLDVYIWSKRDTLESNRNLIMESCKRSDDILNEIHTIVSGWQKDLFTKAEWVVVKQIQAGVMRCAEEIPWQAVPPWSRHTSRLRYGRAY